MKKNRAMNTKTNFSEKLFDAEISKLLHTDHPTKTPDFFTEKVMKQIQQEKKNIQYTPVISKRIWIAIGISILMITGFAMKQPVSSTKTLFTLPKISFYPLWEPINQWFGSLISEGWQMINTSGLLFPFVALFFALGLNFFIMNGVNIRRKNKLGKMYCL